MKTTEEKAQQILAALKRSVEEALDKKNAWGNMPLSGTVKKWCVFYQPVKPETKQGHYARNQNHSPK